MEKNMTMGFTKICKNGKNNDGKTRYVLILPRSAVKELNLDNEYKKVVAFKIWEVDSEEVVRKPVIESRPAVTPEKIEELILQQEKPANAELDESELDFIHKYKNAPSWLQSEMEANSTAQFGSERATHLIERAKRALGFAQEKIDELHSDK